MSVYATLAQVKEELNAEGTVDDAEVMRIIRQVSRRIDQKFKARNLFVPTIQTRRIPIDPSQINSIDGTLSFGVPLLSLTGVGINSQTLTVGTNVQSYPVDVSPSFQLQLLGDAWTSWYTYYCTGTRGIQFAALSGVWGYNADYANAWLEVTTLTAALNSSATTFTVEDIAGPDPYGDEPAISPGHVIQIDSEWMDVIAAVTTTEMDVTTNTLTVVRGVNGSTAAAHLEDAPISVYIVDESIRRAVVRQTAFQYARKGAYDSYRIDGLGATQYPSDMLPEVYALLSLFANM